MGFLPACPAGRTLRGVRRLWVRYRWKFVNYAAMTAFGLLNLSSALRFHSQASSRWVAGSGVLLLTLGSLELFRMWRKLPQLEAD